MVFPNEILFLILQEIITRKDLSQCALVSKQWNLVVTDSYFYRHIDIYVYDPFIKFMEIATKLKSENKRNFGEYVKSISLYFKDVIHNDTMEAFQRCCPNITFIHYLPSNKDNTNKNGSIKYKITKNWKNLKHIPAWHHEPAKDCLSSYKSTLEILTLYMKKEDYMLLKNHHLSPDLRLISKLSNLKELCLSFNKKEACHQIDLNILDLIHSSCPQLNSLTLANNFRIVDTNKNNNIGNNSIISSASSIFYHQWNNINTLCFKNMEVENLSFFTYLSKSYPNMESLTLEKIDYTTDIGVIFGNDDIVVDEWARIRESSINMKGFFTSMKVMMIHLLQQLKKLHVTFGGSCISFPNNQLLNSLSINPPPYLKDLKLPFPIYPIENENTYKYSQWIPLQCDNIRSTSFIYNLHTLYIPLSCSSKSALAYFLDGTGDDDDHKKRNKIISPNLKELYISKLSHNHEVFTIDLYDWLDVFPNLQSLTINNLHIYSDEFFYNDGSSKSIKEQQKQPQYKLKKLIIQHCTIKLLEGFSLLCQRCPQLDYFACTNSRYDLLLFNDDDHDGGDVNTKKNEVTKNQDRHHYHYFIYAPQLNLSTFIINDLKFHGKYPFLYNMICLKTNRNIIDDLGKWNNNEYGIADYMDDIGENEMYREPTIMVHVRNVEHCKYNDKWISFLK